MKILTLKNAYISTLPKLLTYDMTFTEARMRNRFFELAQKKADEVEASRLEICKKFAEKDENGEPKMNGNQFVFPAGETEFVKEFEALFNEDCKIDFPPSMYSDIGGLKRLIELSTVLLTPAEQVNATAILKAFEEIQDQEPEDPEASKPPMPEDTGVKS